MSEIKFRIYDDNRKRYLNKKELGYIVITHEGVTLETCHWSQDFDEDERYSLERYTGMSNIYENDVVLINNYECRVEFRNGAWTLIHNDKDGEEYENLHSFAPTAFEIAGNIHNKKIRSKYEQPVTREFEDTMLGNSERVKVEMRVMNKYEISLEKILDDLMYFESLIVNNGEKTKSDFRDIENIRELIRE